MKKHSKSTPVRALLFDRDGVLNVDVGAAPSPQDIVLLPGVVAGLTPFLTQGTRFFILSNQSAIGRSEDTEENYRACMRELYRLLGEGGILITAEAHCSHDRDAGCACRKPRTGMWDRLRGEYPDLDAHSTVMIGDKDSDMLFGTALGMRTVRVRSAQYPATAPATYTVTTLAELPSILL